MLTRFVRDDSGATALEYALIVAIMAAVIVGSLGDVMQKIEDIFRSLGGEMTERAVNP